MRKPSEKTPAFTEEEKVQARQTVRDAVKRGDIEKQQVCEGCRRQRSLQAHHLDYSQPLLVRWLCATCHTVEHHGTALELRVEAAFKEGRISANERADLLGLPRPPKVCRVCGKELPKFPPAARYCDDHRPAR